MWRVTAGGLELDLCAALAAELVLGRVVFLTRKRGTAELSGRPCILPSHVEKLEAVTGHCLAVTCDEHGAHCP